MASRACRKGRIGQIRVRCSDQTWHKCRMQRIHFPYCCPNRPALRMLNSAEGDNTSASDVRHACGLWLQRLCGSRLLQSLCIALANALLIGPVCPKFELDREPSCCSATRSDHASQRQSVIVMSPDGDRLVVVADPESSDGTSSEEGEHRAAENHPGGNIPARRALACPAAPASAEKRPSSSVATGNQSKRQRAPTAAGETVRVAPCAQPHQASGHSACSGARFVASA